MTYTKPEVSVLGDACAVIELCAKGNCFGDGGGVEPSISAYDLDE